MFQSLLRVKWKIVKTLGSLYEAQSRSREVSSVSSDTDRHYREQVL